VSYALAVVMSIVALTIVLRIDIENRQLMRGGRPLSGTPPDRDGRGHGRPRDSGLPWLAEMQSRGWTVSWLGTPAGMENKLVPPTGIPMDIVAFTGCAARGSATPSRFGRMLQAFGRCWHVIRRRRASAVLAWAATCASPAA